MGSKVVDLMKRLKNTHGVTQHITIKYNNAGENKMAEELCKKEGLNVLFEYTAPNIPQQNGKVERKFATLYGCV